MRFILFLTGPPIYVFGILYSNLELRTGDISIWRRTTTDLFHWVFLPAGRSSSIVHENPKIFQHRYRHFLHLYQLNLNIFLMERPSLLIHYTLLIPWTTHASPSSHLLLTQPLPSSHPLPWSPSVRDFHHQIHYCLYFQHRVFVSKELCGLRHDDNTNTTFLKTVRIQTWRDKALLKKIQ